ncbi:hypothetical protein COEREDRAFT_80352 [Coemansia reversa NRRL 1564]|uniref:NEDD8-activating enzyme E1 regulatory subunit n=1 Tax=Coemansia reversa (strain ATCC 12441 / NRRL 1564) TaxID=763665 RepID=A0A2G5BF68_COERN|nr:hypothetical protein COEREDRAFT_80352 [Coemansia reversa NRRL 1564]|eukprot:PIA17659.1 hypothetical protein COEREDRAFT_80352 [Coemansia reversa NRRL 1564]
MRRPRSVTANESNQGKRMRTESDKAQLYDRQLRLWQKDGQAALERARVLVFGSSTLASELLKDLVLPGIGEFTVVDDATVDEQELRTNFFVRPTDLGRLRAQCIVANLSELNPDVIGQAVVASAVDFMNSNTELFDTASLVIVCAQPESVVCELSRRCDKANIPMLAASSAGFQAEVLTSVSEHTVVESHADTRADLRVMTPFAELRKYADSVNLESMDSTDLAHVPYVVLIIKALDKWAADSGVEKKGLEYKQKSEIATLLREMAPTPDEENFSEAANNVIILCVDYEVPLEVKQILEDPAAKLIASNAQTDSFWLLANALRRYMESTYSEGMLPHSGAIPDMKADTNSYIELQRLYKQKAEQDKTELTAHLHNVLQEASLPSNHVSPGTIDLFCKNANRLRLVRTRLLHQVLESKPDNLEELAGNGVLAHYALFRATDAFYVKSDRYPGAPPQNDSPAKLDDIVQKDTPVLKQIAESLMAESWGVADPEVPEDLAAEFVRSGNLQLHSTSAFVGGILAQEAIKLLTHQYVPHSNITIIDAANSKFVATKV